MAEVRGAMRVPPPVRLLLLLALLGGILTMHAVAITLAPAAAGAPAMVEHHAAGGHSAVGGHTASAQTPCPADGCAPEQHHTGGLHDCVFVMTALSVIAGLALLCWFGIRSATLNVSPPRHECRRRERAPPWTVLSLFELSILRV